MLYKEFRITFTYYTILVLWKNACFVHAVIHFYVPGAHKKSLMFKFHFLQFWEVPKKWLCKYKDISFLPSATYPLQYTLTLCLHPPYSFHFLAKFEPPIWYNITTQTVLTGHTLLVWWAALATYFIEYHKSLLQFFSTKFFSKTSFYFWRSQLLAQWSATMQQSGKIRSIVRHTKSVQLVIVQQIGACLVVSDSENENSDHFPPKSNSLESPLLRPYVQKWLVLLNSSLPPYL